MLEYPLRSGPQEELRWFVAETDALTRLRADAPSGMRERFIAETRHWVMRDLRVGGELVGATSLPARPSGRPTAGRLDEAFWRVVDRELGGRHLGNPVLARSVAHLPHGSALRLNPRSSSPAAALRHRDVLLAATAEDSDHLVHDLLIRFLRGVYRSGLRSLGLARPRRRFLPLVSRGLSAAGRTAAALARRACRPSWTGSNAGIGPLESIVESLELLGVGEDESDDYLAATVLALRGWASMLFQNEVRPDRVPVPVPPGTLVEFLAVRLMLDRLAVAHVAARRWATAGRSTACVRRCGPTRGKRSKAASSSARFWCSSWRRCSVGIRRPCTICRNGNGPACWPRSTAFSGLERRRIFHLAFERRFRTQTLDALSVYTGRPCQRVKAPRFQAVFCIDTREESFRRHLEELIPEAETFSTAGFFGVAIYYRGVADAHFAALCPIVIKPQHWVTEEVVYPLEESNRRGPKPAGRWAPPRTNSTSRSRAFAAGAVLERRAWACWLRCRWWRGSCFPGQLPASGGRPAASSNRRRSPGCGWSGCLADSRPEEDKSGFRSRKCAISASGAARHRFDLGLLAVGVVSGPWLVLPQ